MLESEWDLRRIVDGQVVVLGRNFKEVDAPACEAGCAARALVILRLAACSTHREFSYLHDAFIFNWHYKHSNLKREGSWAVEAPLRLSLAVPLILLYPTT